MRRSRAVRLVILAALILGAAVVLWLADAGTAVVVVVLAAAWAIAAVVEWLSWKDEQASAETRRVPAGPPLPPLPPPRSVLDAPRGWSESEHDVVPGRGHPAAPESGREPGSEFPPEPVS